MSRAQDIVVILHGKESGPDGTKIKRLAEVAEAAGYGTERPDFSGIADPDERVRRLLEMAPERVGRLVLAGSSMGGYVATVAAEALVPDGLFLLAPALYMPPYRILEPAPKAERIAIVHGWRDEVVPVENSLRFAGEHRADLHVLDDDHRLLGRLPEIERLFAAFLDELAAA